MFNLLYDGALAFRKPEQVDKRSRQRTEGEEPHLLDPAGDAPGKLATPGLLDPQRRHEVAARAGPLTGAAAPLGAEIRRRHRDSAEPRRAAGFGPRLSGIWRYGKCDAY